MGQTALEVGFAGVLHRTGVCGRARVCAFLVFLSHAARFFVNTNMHMGVCVRVCVCVCVCVMRSNLLLEFFSPPSISFIILLKFLHSCLS